MARSRVACVVGVVLAALVVLPGIAPTYALFTDSPGLASGAFAGRTLVAPTAVTCTNGPALSGYLDIGWTTATSQARHRVDAESTPGVWVALGTVPVGASSLRVTPTMVASILSLGVTYRVRVVAVAGGAWSSPASTSMTTIATLSLVGLGLSAACA